MKNADQKQIRSMTPFFIIWTGQALSMAGTRVAQFALVWWLTERTGSATVLATATLMAMLPQVVLGPLAGAYVDRLNRRKVMFTADSLLALAALILGYLFWNDAVQIWHIYLLMFTRAVGETFHWPAMQASTSLMVPKKHLARVAGLNQAMQGALTVVAPPLGALSLAILPMHGIMGLDVGTALFAVVPLLFIFIPQPPQLATATEETGQKSSVWADMRQGFQYVWRWPGLLLLMVMAAGLNFILNPAFALLPLLVTQHFQGEALHLGWLEAAFGIGVVLGGLFLGVWGGFQRRIFTSLLGLIGMGIGVLLLGVTPPSTFWIAIAAMLLTGLMNPLINGPIMAIIQFNVTPEMQGRVFTMLSSVVTAISPLSLIVAGPVSDIIGIQPWYIAGGIVCLLMGVAGYFIPTIVNIEQNHAEHSPDSADPTSVGVEVVVS